MKFIILLIMFVNFQIYSQIIYRDSMILNIRSGFILSMASSFPISVSIQTFNSSLSTKEKIVYGGVWLVFGITLDISAVDKFHKAYKYKKLITKNEKI